MQPETLTRVVPLLGRFKMKRSAGVPVTVDVHARIAAGNAARDQRAWGAAAEAFRAALELDPDLVHIWIQQGHALKEAGDLDGAAVAYRRAGELDPEASDPALHLGHVAKLRGDHAAAVRHYLAAARCEPPSTAALSELRRLAMKGGRMEIDELQYLLRDRVDAPPGRHDGPLSLSADDASSDIAAAVRPCVVFDVSDLLAYFNHARTPSGIQRVQLETLNEALKDADRDVRICAFHEARDEWVELPTSLFAELARLSRSGSDEEWSLCLTRLTVRLTTARPLEFPRGAILVNLGTSWWIPNYFMFVRRAKQEAGIRYVPFVHDLIPLVRSELCPPLLVRDFMAWMVSVLEHADFYLVNSQSTRTDLMKVSAYLGQPVDGSRIEVVTLDAVPDRLDERDSRHVLGRSGLQREPYVLFVSTIEPRKNHIRAFEAWSRLIERHGARRVPKLVCVGNSGWMNGPIHDYLNGRPDLKAKVLLLSGISDEELDGLYAHCVFTLYPSHYEGWGLPVTESLGHGKVPLCALTSSVPEAGGAFADYFALESAAELVAGVERLAFDNAYRRSREAGIANGFRPRSWQAIAQQIIDRVAHWTTLETSGGGALPQAELGRFYSLSADLAPRLWPGLRSTEGFRSGRNWWGRDPWGCWTKPGGATLQFRVADATKRLRMYVELHGMPHVRCDLRIDANGHEAVEETSLDAGERKWLSFEVAGNAEAQDPVTIDLVCSTFEELGKTLSGGDTRAIAVGVAGFYLCEADDAVGRMALLEAVSLGSVETLSANRPPADCMSLQAFLDTSHEDASPHAGPDIAAAVDLDVARPAIDTASLQADAEASPHGEAAPRATPPASAPAFGIDDVRAAYRLFLGRDADDDATVASLVDTHPDIWRLVEAFYGSSEARRLRLAEACQTISLEQDGRDIEISAGADALAQLTSHIEAVWERYGREEAYYSVLTNPKYLSASLGSDDVEHFYGTGVGEVQRLHGLCQRNGVDPNPSWTMLELGCGVGRMAEPFVGSHAHYIGVDISAEHLALARERIAARQVTDAEFLLLKAFLDTPPDYDFFFSTIVLQHNPPPIIHGLLDHALRHLKPGGYAAFQVPCHLYDYDFSVEAYLNGEGRHDHMEMHALPQRHIFALLRKHGLTPIEVAPNERIGPLGFSYDFFARKDAAEAC